MRFLLIHILVFLSFGSWSQSLSFRHFTVQDGLAQSVVRSVLPDSRGFVWLGTQGGGLSRYDGLNFVNFSTREGLPDNRVNVLYEDDQARLWIGTDKGLAYYEGRTIQAWGQRKLNVKALGQDTAGQLWIGTASGLYKLQDQSVQRLSGPSRQVNAIFTDQSGHTWLGTRQGLWELVGGLPRQIEGWSEEILAVTEDPNGLLYLSTLEEGLMIWDGANFSPFVGNRWLPKGKIESLYLQPDKGLWMGTEKGLYLWDIEGLSMQELSLGREQQVMSMGQDIWGNLWLGTDQGASLYGGQLFDFYRGGSSARPQAVRHISATVEGAIQFTVEKDGWYQMTDSSLQQLDLSPYSSLTINEMVLDSQLGNWLATQEEGLLLKGRDTIWQMGEEFGVDAKGIKDLALDANGLLYALPVSGGLLEMRIAPDSVLQWEVIKWGLLEGLPTQRLNSMHLDQRQRLWICTADAGLLCWKKGALLYHFRKGAGLPTNELVSITEDTSGYLWVGSQREGLMRLEIYQDSIGVEQYTYRQGLFSNTVNSVLCTRKQELWLGSQSGVDRLVLDEDRHLKSIQHFGPSEGFQGVETVPNAAFEDAEGNLWWGTVAGLVKYNTALATTSTVPPGIVMTDIQLFTQSLMDTPYRQALGPWHTLDTTLLFTHNQNNFTFTFLGTEQNQATKIRYQYWLEGWDQDWSAETENKEITYANLPPGSYTFRVRSLHKDTRLASDPIQVRFAIAAPWWEWRSVRWGVILAATAFILGLFWKQIRRIRRAAWEAEERLRLDKHVLELEQKALQLQMNPHFIFNALNSIQLLIGKQDAKTARRYLAKFSKLMRATLENARAPKILLAEEVDSLETYLAIEQFSRGNAFDYELKVTPEAEAEEVHIPPMMVQPFVENAIIHGIGPLQRKGMIKVVFEVLAEEVICLITDNGVGLQNDNTGSNHQSLALQVTRERLQLLSANGASPTQTFEIGSNPAGETGTYVKIHLPLLS